MIVQTIKRNAAKRETPRLIQMVCAAAGEELRVVHIEGKKMRDGDSVVECRQCEQRGRKRLHK